jgi:hypothetical protein
MTRALMSSQSDSSSMTSHVGIFADAENVTDYLKQGGAEKLVELASEYGNPVVRMAFGDWAQGLRAHQELLVANGFKLEHTPHPVPKKEAADIAMAVDVIATLHKMPNLTCFVLATGDSDFGPLFRHLRQEGRTVIGVGRRSELCNILKNTADRFVFTDTPKTVVATRSTGIRGKRSTVTSADYVCRKCLAAPPASLAPAANAVGQCRWPMPLTPPANASPISSIPPGSAAASSPVSPATS